MAIFDLSGLTMNPTEVDDVSKAIFELVIEESDLAEHHEIETGITRKTQIAFVGNPGLVGKVQTDCDRAIDDFNIPITQKYWELVTLGIRLKHCATDVNALLKLFKKASRMNPDFYDRIGSQELGLVIAKLEQAIKQMLNRLVWFGDTAAANVSGAGVIKNGIDVAYFTPINGLFKQIFADIPVTAANYVEISENAGASYVAQELTDDKALAIFRNMHNATDARFYQAIAGGAQPKLFVTRELMQNYWNTLENKSLNFSLGETQDGVSKMSYRGIPIIVRYDWDDNIRSYQDNGTKFNLPNRAILTLKENIPVATLSESDLDAVTSFYVQKDKANYMDVDMNLDTKHLLNYYTVAAY